MNQYVGPIKAMVENAVRGEPAHFEFGGAHPRAYTHARDIASLVVAMLDAPDDADRIFYGSTGGAMATTTEVAQIVRELVPGADVEIGEELSEAEKPVVALRARALDRERAGPARLGAAVRVDPGRDRPVRRALSSLRRRDRMTFDVAVLPGDGIGPEVVAEAVRVLRRVEELSGGEVALRLETFAAGRGRLAAHR